MTTDGERETLDRAFSAYYPSIFNDVIGPIMRGPSSSHCAASVRIGRMARDLMDGDLEQVQIAFDPNGSLATTHATQGSDMGLFGGLLGWDAPDERLVDSAAAIRKAGIEVTIRISAYGAEHPNTYKLTLRNANTQHETIAISTGGGMIEVVEIDGISVSMRGDYYETLVYVDGNVDRAARDLAEQVEADAVQVKRGPEGSLIEIKAQRFPDEGALADHGADWSVRAVKRINPVLPVLSRREIQVPFVTCEQMVEYNASRDLELWQLAVHYESARGDVPEEQVFRMMRHIVGIMHDSIRTGLQGTEYADRILGYQSGRFATEMSRGRLLDAGLLNRMILYVTAMMEIKSSMGVIVAAPTAGACGGLPGACIGAADAMGLGPDEMTKAMLAAGMIGVLIAARSTFAAEVCGCQAECGAGSGMAAAALVTLAEGTTEQAIGAASMALQNILGMICDPVGNRVEVPCLGRNVLAAGNALACANMSLAGYDAVIPLDEVIDTMDAVGKSIPAALRCTALGGLSMTPTAKAIERRLSQSGRGPGQTA